MNEQLADLIKMTDEMVKYRTLYEENAHRYSKLLKGFNELIEESEEYRNRLGMDSNNWKYDVIERAGLLDDYE
jgi:hypothetical protein